MIDYPFYNKKNGHWSKKKYSEFTNQYDVMELVKFEKSLKNEILSKKCITESDIKFLDLIGFNSKGKSVYFDYIKDCISYYDNNKGYWLRKEFCEIYNLESDINIVDQTAYIILKKDKLCKNDIDFLHFLWFNDKGRKTDYYGNEFIYNETDEVGFLHYKLINEKKYEKIKLKMRKFEDEFLETSDKYLPFIFSIEDIVESDKYKMKEGVKVTFLIKNLKDIFNGLLTNEELASKIFHYIETDLTKITILSYIKSRYWETQE